MEPLVVLSDVHGNLEALEAVLARVADLGPSRVYSLGDTVGYGPNPVECLRLARQRFELLLMGNHELGAIRPSMFTFNHEADVALRWTRERLREAGEIDGLEELQITHLEGDMLFAHGSVRHPVTDYIQETNGWGLSTFDDIVQQLERDFTGFRICFVGHNHKPFLATREGFIHPHEGKSEFCVTDEKLYVCVGSVGQPRDDDPRACFVVYDGQKVQYHRVEYPVEQTVAKIRAQPLPPVLAERLLHGY